MKFKPIPGSITAPQGFLAGATFCDLKRLGTGKGSDKGQKRDLAIILSEVTATVAGMFTTNRVCAAPVKLCLDHLQHGTARAIVANSGNANACTGRRGLRDAYATARVAAKVLRLPAQAVLVASTGRIGLPLPMVNLRRGLRQAAALFGSTAEHSDQAAEAIMTSDTRPKQVAVELKIGGRPVRLGGICKGAGMIQPGMSASASPPAAMPSGLHATMLCFLTTDAAVERATLGACLERAVAQSFNRITVDGDMSTNDTVLVFANGLAGHTPLSRAAAARHAASRRDLAHFQTALNHVTLELAKMIVRDGEGVSRIVTVRVRGAASFADAEAGARAVANSALVKTSWHGGDPNWGRIIAALGYARARVVENQVDIGYSAPGSRKVLYSLKRGQPTAASYRELCAAVADREFDLHIHLHQGTAETVVYAADLTEEYVAFNKGDISDPASLGG